MKQSKTQKAIIENIKSLSDDKAREVLDFILFLKQQKKTKIIVLKKTSKTENRDLLLDLKEGLFDGEDEPNNTASEHDKYLYGSGK